MALSLTRIAVYIPKFGRQRDEGVESPVTFYIKIMGATEFRAFSSKISETKDDSAAMFSEYGKMVSEHVVTIDNLDIEGKAITDGQTLCACDEIPNALMTEIEAAILDVSRIKEEEAKN